MKKIATDGIYSMSPVEGIDGWYYGCDHCSGDLYEAEEIYKSGRTLEGNKLVFIHYPDGRTVLLPAGKGRYWGNPLGLDGYIYLLLVDFGAGSIELSRYSGDMRACEAVAEMPLASVENCYNLMMKPSPPTLIRHSSDDVFELIWPERVKFEVGRTEAFDSLCDGKLYFSAWYEDPDYREEVVVRDAASGAVIERLPGALWRMPDGQMWILK